MAEALGEKVASIVDPGRIWLDVGEFGGPVGAQDVAKSVGGPEPASWASQNVAPVIRDLIL